MTVILTPPKNENGEWVIVYPDTNEEVVIVPNEDDTTPDDPTQDPSDEPTGEPELTVDEILATYNTEFQGVTYNALDIKNILSDAKENGITYEALQNREEMHWMIQRQPETSDVILPMIHEMFDVERLIAESKVLDSTTRNSILADSMNLPTYGYIRVREGYRFQDDGVCGVYITLSIPYEFKVVDGWEKFVNIVFDVYDLSKYKEQGYDVTNFSFINLYDVEVGFNFDMGCDCKIFVDNLGILGIMGIENEYIIAK